jgi:hypothetical protein
MSDLVKRLREDAEHIRNQPDYVGSPDYSADLALKAAARIERLEAALRPFAFFEPEDPEDSNQKAWELIYQDRVRDWIDFEEIAEARAALGKTEKEPTDGTL